MEDTTKEAKQDGRKKSDVNHVMQKILKQQKHLLSHLVKLDINCGGHLSLSQEWINSNGRHQKGKGYILQTFLDNIADSIEGVNSHDSGIGSAIPGNVGSSTNNFTDENDFQSFDTFLNGRQEDSIVSLEFHQINDLIKGLETIVELNTKIENCEETIERLNEEIKEESLEIDKHELEQLSLRSDMADLKEECERMLQINSRLSHDIKRNDLSLSHMMKNFEGRRAFMNTIELDINRAESYGKRLQHEFEREFETLGMCKDIVIASESFTKDIDTDRLDLNDEGGEDNLNIDIKCIKKKTV